MSHYLKNTTLEHNAFLEARDNYIKWSNDPENLGKRCSEVKDRKRKVVSTVGVEEILEEPEEELVELSVWQEENKQFADPKTGAKADPTMAGLTVITRKKPDGTLMKCVKLQIGPKGHLGWSHILYILYYFFPFSTFIHHFSFLP